jgi:hypothetical protein
MRGDPLNMAVDNMLHIFETHVHEHDAVSLVRFDHRTFEEIPIQVRGAETAQLKARFEAVRHIEDMGGTAMYAALATAIRQATSAGFDKEAWIICLTDGCSTDKPDAVLQQLRVLPNVHVIIIGIGLPGRVLPTVRDVCKARDDSKGQYIPAGGLDALNEAFATAASLLPVSQTFDLDGDLSGDECRALMTHYMPETARRSILLQHYWVQYLHRRVKVFDESHDFNYNQTHEELGGTLMTTMLSEVERALNDEHRRKWKSEDHQQLIYDFSHEGGPRFGLVSTAPELMDPGVRAAYEALDFEIPTSVELRDRNRLDDYLARALGIALDENGRVAALDEEGFVITLDFLLKLLNIHERVACRIPCLMEGETGVSKTALTKMYAILVNTAAQSELEAAIESGLQEIVDEVDDAHSSSISRMLASKPAEKLSAALADTNVDELTTGIVELLQRLPMLETPDNELVRCARDPDETPEDRMESTRKLLQWIAGTPIVQTYFQVRAACKRILT